MQKESEAMRRYRTSGLKFEQDNEFYSTFRRSPAIGLEFEEGVVRRDPSDIIKVGEFLYVWYTRTAKGPPAVGPEKATETLRAFPWDLAEIWYATSADGKTWTEQGLAVPRGPK
ncbi:MAG: hypothetical protein ABI748_09315, partial [Dokdonella sp.]